MEIAKWEGLVELGGYQDVDPRGVSSEIISRETKWNSYRVKPTVKVYHLRKYPRDLQSDLVAVNIVVR